MPLTCPRWGDGSLWGDGDLWCGISGYAQYIAWLEGADRGALTTWNLQSPDTNVWTPTITTAGIVSFASSVGTATTVPVAPAPDGDNWTPSISNAGLITLTEGVDAAEDQASLIDSDEDQWWWAVPESDGVSTWSTRVVVGARQKLHHISTQVEYSGGDSFIITSIRLLCSIASQLADRFVAYTDFTTHKRVSVQVVFAGGAEFVIDRIHVLANARQQQPRG